MSTAWAVVVTAALALMVGASLGVLLTVVVIAAGRADERTTALFCPRCDSLLETVHAHPDGVEPPRQLARADADPGQQPPSSQPLAAPAPAPTDPLTPS